jgi:hypothetical protein
MQSLQCKLVSLRCLLASLQSWLAFQNFKPLPPHSCQFPLPTDSFSQKEACIFAKLPCNASKEGSFAGMLCCFRAMLIGTDAMLIGIAA